MSETMYTILSLDFPPLVAALFSAMSCALLGNFLVVRKMALMGDAISHAVLPGIVLAFLLSGSRASLPIFIGAAIAGVITTILIELIRKHGNVESSASIGVVFSLLFALGVLLMEQAAARSVDLDADCLLHGQLESIFWYPPGSISDLLSINTLWLLPDEIFISLSVFLVCIGMVTLLYKELVLSSFDASFASSLGFSTNSLHYLLMILVAGTVVASFEIVGSILVIGMIICPPASARLLTDVFLQQIILSLLLSALSVTTGYFVAAHLPIILGFENSLSASGMIVSVSGLFLFLCAIFAPKYGAIGKHLKNRELNRQIVRDDILGFLYRLEEDAQKVSESQIGDAFSRASIKGNIPRLIDKGFVRRVDGALSLTEKGRVRATQIIRSHRLWEDYFVSHLGLSSDHVHPSAETLEHFTSVELQEKLESSQGYPQEDPHGKKIPKGNKTLD